MKNIKLGDKIYQYLYLFKDGSGKSAREVVFTSEVYDVIGVNEQLLVLNDKNFTTVAHGDKWSSFCRVNVCDIYTEDGDDWWGNSLTYKIYSSTKLSAEYIKDEINEFIENKKEFLSSVDLNPIAVEV